MSRQPNAHRRAIRHALALAVVAALSAPAHAQTAAVDAADTGREVTELDAVIVTGRSGIRERTKAETSYSVTRIDEERLRMQAPTSVAEAMKSVPGFWVEASGGEASGNIRARGIPVDGFGSVNLLEDGIPVQHDPALGYLNADQVFRLDETIERVEVVRGGPSSVFYSNAPAGVINFVPRVVGDHAEGIAKYTWGDYGLGRLDFFYGTPLGSGDWKLGVGGFYRQDDGIREPGFDANKGGQFRVNLSRAFERGDVLFDFKRIDDNVALFLGTPMRTRADGEIRAVPGFDGNFGTMAGPETGRMQLLQGDGTYYDFDNSVGTGVDRDQYTFKLNYDLGAGFKLAQALRYSDTQTQRNGVFPLQLQGAAQWLQGADARKALASVPGATSLQLRYATDPSQVFDTADQNGNGLLVVGGLRGVTAPMTEFINDTRLMRRFEFDGGQSHDVTFGYYHARFDQDFDRYSSNVLLDVRDNARLLDLVAVDAAGNPLATITDGGIYRNGYEWENSSGRSTTNALYLSDEWQVNERFRLDGGVRWEEVNVEGWMEIRKTVNLGTFPNSNMLTGSGQFVDYDEDFSKSGWTLGANYQFSPYQGAFARWTSAFRLPNLSSYITRWSNCSLADVDACVRANSTRPITQTMDLAEVGYKFTHQVLDVYATAFYTKYDNVGFSNSVFDLNGTVQRVEQGYASTRTVGLELEAAWYPVDWFDLQLTATLQNPEYENLRYTEAVNGAPVLRDFVGNQLIRVPRQSLRVVPGVNLLDRRLRLQLTWEYEGERYVDTANSVRLPSYDVLSASARYDITPQWSVFGYADNIDNSLGLTEGNPRAGELQSGDAGANTFLARPLLGRSYRLAVIYRF
ncbi:MAG: TonB-dependent receptor [Pseudoxanthomonas sp.]|nr:TonB-dependent receptor [Pseudoxanthomonas sp.]